MRKVLSAVGLAAISALALGACGGDDAGEELGEKIAEDLADDATGGSVNVDDGEITYEGEDGEGSVTFGGGEMPEELADFPLPDGAEVTSSMSSSSDTGSGAWVTVAANGDYEEVSAEMQSALGDAGYEISGTYESETNGVGNSTYTFEGNGVTGTVAITEDETTNEGFNLQITIMTGEDTTTDG